MHYSSSYGIECSLQSCLSIDLTLPFGERFRCYLCKHTPPNTKRESYFTFLESYRIQSGSLSNMFFFPTKAREAQSIASSMSCRADTKKADSTSQPFEHSATCYRFGLTVFQSATAGTIPSSTISLRILTRCS